MGKFKCIFDSKNVFLALILCFYISKPFSCQVQFFSSNFHNIHENEIHISPLPSNKTINTCNKILTVPSLTIHSIETPKILFIIGDDYNPDPIKDTPFYNYMTLNLSFNVVYHDDNNSYAFDNFDAIIISETIIDPNNVNLSNANIPVLTMERLTWNIFDLGSVEGKRLSSVSQITILENSSYITSQVALETISIYNTSGIIDTIENFNVAPPQLQIIQLASSIGAQSSKQRTLAVLDKGSSGWLGKTAPERRAFWGGIEGSYLNPEGWELWERTIKWILYDDSSGNATIEINTYDLDDKPISNAEVTIIDANNSSVFWKQNTSQNGKTTFTNVTYGLYNFSAEYESSINDTLCQIKIMGNHTYYTESFFTFSIKINEFIDNNPPIIWSLDFISENNSFIARVTDESSIRTVNLSITIQDAINGTKIRDKSYNMIPMGNDRYLNDTALQGILLENINLTYNVTAIDIAYNIKISPTYTTLIGDLIPPIIHEYNVTDLGNGTAVFYANITDNQSSVDHVTLRINNSLFYMSYNTISNLWVYSILEYYGKLLNYTIYSVNDTAGNEAGAKVANMGSSNPFGLIFIEDNQAPNIWGLTDTFSLHIEGFVEIIANISDWSIYQSGIDPTTATIHIIRNGTEGNYTMVSLGGIRYSFNFTFTILDNILYYISACDFAGNMAFTEQQGPFLINDTSIPTVYYSGKEFGNGTIEIKAIVIDWPINYTTAFLHYTQQWTGIWNITPMQQINDTFFLKRIHNLDYQLTYFWCFIEANDSSNNYYQETKEQAMNLTLTDKVAPTLFCSISHSTIIDGEITLNALAIDLFGVPNVITNPFYVNVTCGSFTTKYNMSLYSFYNWSFTKVFYTGEIVTFNVYTQDNAGNIGNHSISVVILDKAPPYASIVDIYDFQNYTIRITAETYDGIYGSGFPESNSSILLIIQFKGQLYYQMSWNGSGNYYQCYLNIFKPGDDFYYQIKATDVSGNNITTLLAYYSVKDITPPTIYSSGVNEMRLISSYMTRIVFSINTSDNFGKIQNVTLIFTYFDESYLINESFLMIENNSIYMKEVSLVCNRSFEYYFVINDGWNIIRTLSRNNVSIDFSPPIILNHGVYYKNQSHDDIGRAHIWIQIDYPFINPLNVTLDIYNVSNGEYIKSNITMDYNNTHYYKSVYIPYLTIYTYTIYISDNAVLEGFYPIIVISTNNQIIMVDIWPPTIWKYDLDILNDTAVRIWANISFYGFHITDVSLQYSYVPDVGSGGFGAMELNNSINMKFNGTFYFIDLTLFNSGTLYWVIFVIDENDRSTITPMEENKINIPIAGPNTNFPSEWIIIIGIAMSMVILSFTVGYYYLVKIRSVSEKQKEYIERFYDLLRLRAIIIRTNTGIPFYKKSYRIRDQDGDLIAGISSAFSNLISHVSKSTLGFGKFDLFERDNFTILSHQGSYSVISLISEGKVSDYTKLQISKLHKKLEEEFSKELLEDPIKVSKITKDIDRLCQEYLPISYHKPLLVENKIFSDNYKKFSRQEKKCIEILPNVPSFIDGQKVFFAMTLITTLIGYHITLNQAITFLEKSFTLGGLRNLKEEELIALNVPDDYRFP